MLVYMYFGFHPILKINKTKYMSNKKPHFNDGVLVFFNFFFFL